MKATNNAWAAPVEAADRRYAIFQSSDEHANDQKYFRPIIREQARGGRSAMLHELLHWDLGGWHPRTDLPATAAKAEQQTLSLAPELQWLLGLITAGVLPYADDRYASRCTSQSGLYAEAKKSSPLLRFWSDIRFSNFLDDWGIEGRRSGGAYREFGDLQELRARWMARFSWYRGFDQLPADQEWTTEEHMR